MTQNAWDLAKHANWASPDYISQKTYFCTYLLRSLFFRTRCDSMQGLGETTSILKPEKKVKVGL
jgi:hypothetical protein